MKVGSLVECVNDDFPPRKDTPFTKIPIKGEIYTVREIELDGILLVEIVNPPRYYKQGFCERQFKIIRFREIQPPMDLSELMEETQITTA